MQKVSTESVPTQFDRQIDCLGRIVLPFAYRHALDIKEQDTLCITLDAERKVIVLSKSFLAKE